MKRLLCWLGFHDEYTVTVAISMTRPSIPRPYYVKCRRCTWSAVCTLPAEIFPTEWRYEEAE